VRCAAAAKGSAATPKKTAAQSLPDAPRTGKWSAVVCSAEWLLNNWQNEAFAEQLRERSRYYQERGWERDFFIVPNPTFLAEQFPDLAKRVRQPSVAVVSSDPIWINFMKLRLDRVAKVEIGDDKAKALASNDESLPDYDGNAEDMKRNVPYGRYRAGWWKSFYPSA